MWVFGKPDMDSFMAWAPQMTLDGVVERITVPYLVTHGAGDRQIPVEAAHRSYEQAVNSARRELRIFTAEDGGVEHVSADNMAPAKDYIADWVADEFARQDGTPVSASRQAGYIRKLFALVEANLYRGASENLNIGERRAFPKGTAIETASEPEARARTQAKLFPQSVPNLFTIMAKGAPASRQPLKRCTTC
ncbi:hypothetical protein GCM10008023_40980 [Sphingomonas glacialis]|uniref:Peptidase S9 prolyl oligopeptidase catalytic domain-containing protein n=1 Tax=Sphingomonas glacialis TaxID=658225 RepID=A0ABQ3LUF7_9SPHN|nr:alpha/beta hydrolase [Sphingomonas glacialis]GHH26418.1 hypothetical protein GCM10008023_40980 [Sphingomonas glacialis]